MSSFSSPCRCLLSSESPFPFSPNGSFDEFSFDRGCASLGNSLVSALAVFGSRPLTVHLGEASSYPASILHKKRALPRTSIPRPIIHAAGRSASVSSLGTLASWPATLRSSALSCSSFESQVPLFSGDHLSSSIAASCRRNRCFKSRLAL